MRVILIFLIFVISSFGLSQTSFDKGYDAGYKNGYCHNKPIGCVAPVSPVPPVPNHNESSDSYQNGYDRGFADGLNSQNEKGGSNETVGPRGVRYDYQPIKFDPQAEFMRNEIIRMGTELAFLNYNKGNYDMAIDYAQKAMESTGIKTKDLCFIMGMAYSRLYYYKSARKWLKKAGWKQHPTAWEEWLKVKADYQKNKKKWSKA